MQKGHRTPQKAVSVRRCCVFELAAPSDVVPMGNSKVGVQANLSLENVGGSPAWWPISVHSFVILKCTGSQARAVQARKHHSEPRQVCSPAPFTTATCTGMRGHVRWYLTVRVYRCYKDKPEHAGTTVRFVRVTALLITAHFGTSGAGLRAPKTGPLVLNTHIQLMRLRSCESVSTEATPLHGCGCHLQYTGTAETCVPKLVNVV